MGVLIDSDVLIDLERSRKGGALLPDGESYFISVVSAGELLGGAERGTPEVRLRRRLFAEEVLRVFSPIEVTLPVARVRAQLWSLLADEGRPIGANDLWIAATAVTHDLALLTRNAAGFARVPGLRVQVP